MIQSPRGSIDIIAHNSFDIQVAHIRTNQDIDLHNQAYTNIDNSDSSDQLVWINPIRQSLSQQT